jgi:glycine/D-amino acid oxidase-like deaminating enzyme
VDKGVVLLAPDAKNFDMLAGTVEARNAFYGTGDFALPADRLGEVAGGRAAERFAGALVMADAHTVQPARMMAGLAALARRLGVTVCERTEVVGLERSASGFRVTTNGGDALARDVLLATGGYTGQVEPFLWQRTLGLPSIASVSEELPEDEVGDVFRSGRALLVNRNQSYVCRPTTDGRRIVLGGPVGQVPATPAEDARRLHAWFTHIFPDLEGIEFTHCWTGLIAATRDGQGHEGAHDGAWYAVGASGIVSCADAGRRMAQHVLHRDRTAATGDTEFPRWPLRASESLLWRGIEWSARLRDLLGRSRLR